MTIAVQRGMHLRQLDVTTAFLHEQIDENIYLYCPNGFKVPEGCVLKLQKSLYGLKQSPKNWNRCFNDYITILGFVKTRADYCIYVKQLHDVIMYLLLYVDDIIIACSDMDKVNHQVIGLL